ncbi:hypothetical protein EVAR_20066_1 [Eumeta japonica]|uniref:Uncharacterized protein n=1 Tax=Eumeta variegata TaxID=151549 RepID=A0A4C1UJA2_EUMVA|nr:hypothetical protein EVAR_20066_1 [Eumeta japonica]
MKRATSPASIAVMTGETGPSTHRAYYDRLIHGCYAYPDPISRSSRQWARREWDAERNECRSTSLARRGEHGSRRELK